MKNIYTCMFDESHRKWNIDETGFTMDSKPGKVIGLVKSVAPVDWPHISASCFIKVEVYCSLLRKC